MVSLYYSLPYLFLIMCLLFLFFNEQRRFSLFSKGVSISLAFLIVLFFLGGCFFVKADWVSYYPFFQSLPTIGEFNLSKYRIVDSYWLFEIGFVVYSAIVKTFCPDYFVWMFVNVAIDLGIFIFILHRFKVASVILPIIVWLSLYGFETEINQLRSSKAVAILLLSLVYVEKRSIVKFYALVLLAYTFHHVSLAFVPVYFMNKRNLSSMWMIVLFIIGTFSYFTNILFIRMDLLLALLPESDAMSVMGYSERGAGRNVSLSGIWDYLINAIAFVVLLIVLKRNSNRKSFDVLVYNLSFLSICSALFLSFSYDVAHRISLLFVVAHSIVFTKYYFFYCKTNRSLQLIFILFCLVSTSLNNCRIFDTYKNVLFTSQSISMRMSQALENISRYSGRFWTIQSHWYNIKP